MGNKIDIREPELESRAQAIAEAIGQAAEEGRAALHSLRGSTTASDLADALRRAAENPARPAGLTVSVATTGAPRPR